MSSKRALLPVILASGQSLATPFTSAATVITYVDNVAYVINVTTTDSTGAFSVQVSEDYAPPPQGSNLPANPGTWTTLTLSGIPTVAAANDTIAISLNQVPFNAIRVAYTPANAGTGTCKITIQTKGLS